MVSQEPKRSGPILANKKVPTDQLQIGRCLSLPWRNGRIYRGQLPRFALHWRTARAEPTKLTQRASAKLCSQLGTATGKPAAGTKLGSKLSLHSSVTGGCCVLWLRRPSSRVAILAFLFVPLLWSVFQNDRPHILDFHWFSPKMFHMTHTLVQMTRK